MAEGEETADGVTGYLAPDGFVDELLAELGPEVSGIHGRLVLAPGPPRPAAWVANLWHEPQRIAIASIGDAFRNAPAEDIDLWSQWDRIGCPTLVLRGAQSDLLRPPDAEAMTRRGPKARLIEFPGIGHAPALMADDQIAVIRDFLLG